ncbi:MAG: hypothetical protein K5739_00650 [Lachnospiraceae bacterium]|nr:hypothetical protein [Lachnospiraceae bacterium]
MKRVKSKKAISKLALSGIRSNIKKYMVLIGAVILTTLLFSSLFTVGGSAIEEIQISSMRKIGTTYQAGFKYLSEPEYEQVKDDPRLKEVSYNIMVGYLSGENLKKLPTEVYYSEEQSARKSFCYPEVGNLPAKENEIVTSDLVLEKLGVPAEVGSTFTTTLLVDDEEITQEFVLSGYYHGDKVAMAQMALVSKELQEKYAPVKMITYPERKDNGFAGWMSVNLEFYHSFNIEESVVALIERTVHCFGRSRFGLRYKRKRSCGIQISQRYHWDRRSCSGSDPGTHRTDEFCQYNGNFHHRQKQRARHAGSGWNDRRSA